MKKLALLVALTGCVTAVRAPSERQKRLDALETPPMNYEREWQAAQVCNELADEDMERGREKTERREFAKRGLDHAERAAKMKPGLVEGHYYKMVCLGRYLDLIVPDAILVADLRTEGELVARLDERYECAGAHRFLAIFYYQCPETGPYGYGDLEKAESHFQRALELFPDCPENRTAYAEYQINKMENPEGARESLEIVLKTADTHPGLSPEQRDAFKKKAQKMLDGIKTK